MKTVLPLCAKCRHPLSTMLLEGPDGTTRDNYECHHSGCELEGLSQPQDGQHVVAGFSRDGEFLFFQRGRSSQNEENLPTLMKWLEKFIPKGLEVRPFDGTESGADIELYCRSCAHRSEIQVVRAMDSKVARDTARNCGIAWSKYDQTSVLNRVLKAVEKKSQKYPSADMRHRLLVVDADVQVYWLVILGRCQEWLRSKIGSTEWRGIVLAGPIGLIWLSPEVTLSACDCR